VRRCGVSAFGFGFTLPRQVSAMSAFEGLDVLEFTLGVPDGVEFFAGTAPMGGASCFARHDVFPFVSCGWFL